jgi:serine O-acetyltransferase
MFERLREDINCIFERDPAARNVFEIVTIYPGFQALLAHRLAHRLWRERPPSSAMTAPSIMA